MLFPFLSLHVSSLYVHWLSLSLSRVYFFSLMFLLFFFFFASLFFRITFFSTFLRLLHGTLSMERGHIQSIFRRLQNLALFAGLRPGSQECCRILFASSLQFLVVQASCGFLPLILSKAFFRFRSPQLPSSSPPGGSVWLEAVLNRLGYTGLHRLVQFAPVRFCGASASSFPFPATVCTIPTCPIPSTAQSALPFP